MSDFVDVFEADVPDAFRAQITEFVRECMRDMTALNMTRVRKLSALLTRLALWCVQDACYPLERDVVLSPEAIAEFVERGCPDLKPASRGTYRSRLLELSDALTSRGSRRAQLPSIGRGTPSTPYTVREIELLREWAASQSTANRRVNLAVLQALGFGAGLTSVEILNVRAGDITIDELGLIVHVRGEHEREVPVLAEWEEPTASLAQAAMRKSQWLYKPTRRVAFSKNHIDNMVAESTPCSVRLNVTRMRTTWIVGHLAAGIPVTSLVKVAGLESFDALRRYLPHVPELDNRVLRGRLRREKEIFGPDGVVLP